MEPTPPSMSFLEALGETIWRAQREGKPMDALAYVDAVRRAASLL